jgi:hypothetical protein
MHYNVKYTVHLLVLSIIVLKYLQNKKNTSSDKQLNQLTYYP